MRNLRDKSTCMVVNTWLILMSETHVQFSVLGLFFQVQRHLAFFMQKLNFEGD